jgi:prepilin signal peptidase PulO-like enzyme (type II secretory pathway)
MLMQYFFGIIVFWLGTALGSFIAVIGSRYNTGLSFLKGRSVCFSCNKELSKKDLLPIVSFLFLRGRCRYCKSKIPISTFFVEIIMGLLSVLAALKVGIFDNFQFSIFNFQLIFNFLILTVIFGTILLISVYDLKHFIIPDSFLIFLFFLSFLYILIPNLSIFPSFHFSLLLTTGYLLLTSVLSGFVLSLPFFLLFLISKGTWFGLGDVKYIFVFGFFLGFSAGLSALVLAFWIGAVFSVLALLVKKLIPRINLPLLRNNLTIKSEIPFGPFLSLGIIISFYLNADLFQIHSLFNVF